MDDTQKKHGHVGFIKNSKVFQSLFAKKGAKDLSAFSNLNLQIPELENPENEESPTSVVVSPGSNSVFDSPKEQPKHQKSTTVVPYDSRDLSDEYVLSPVEIGRGRSGIVKDCVHKITGEVMACKIVDKTKMKPKGRRAKALNLEVKLALGLCSHPNIIKYYGIYEDAQKVYFIMEKCRGGDLFDLITKRGRLTEKESARMLRKIGEVVAFAHSKGVVHRDIKPENIMINNHCEMEPKVGDFGEAYVMSCGKNAHGMAGSPPYMAPEIILGMDYGYAVDVWSLGILFYIMLSGLLPFSGSSANETFEFILAYEPNFSISPWDMISPGAKRLVRKMLCKDPIRRWTMKEVLADSWLRSLSD